MSLDRSWPIPLSCSVSPWYFSLQSFSCRCCWCCFCCSCCCCCCMWSRVAVCVSPSSSQNWMKSSISFRSSVSLWVNYLFSKRRFLSKCCRKKLPSRFSEKRKNFRLPFCSFSRKCQSSTESEFRTETGTTTTSISKELYLIAFKHFRRSNSSLTLSPTFCIWTRGERLGGRAR